MGSRLLHAFHEALAERSAFEATWREIAALVHPTRAQFQTGAPVSGTVAGPGGFGMGGSGMGGSGMGGLRTPTRRPATRLQVYDSTALLAAENLASGLFGALTNPASRWFQLEAEPQAWAETVETRINDAFNAGGQAFYTVLPDLFRDLVSFGTAVLAVRPGPRFFVRRLEDIALEADGEGEIVRLFRRFRLRAGPALRRFGPNTPELLRRSAEKDGRAVGDFIEVTEPLPTRSRGLLEPRVVMTVIDADSGRVLESRTRADAPEIVLRWSTAGGGPYGDSPAMLALPDVKTLNAMCKASLLAAQKAVDPPILSAHEHGMRGLKTHPGAVIYGGLDASGRRLYQPFMDGANPGLSLEMEEQRRAQIREAFFASLLTAARAPNETATAFLGRQEEKARLLAPYLARLQSELLEPLIQRVFGLLYRAGSLPRYPGASLRPVQPRVRLVSPLAQAQRLSEAARHLRLIEGVSGLGLEPDALVHRAGLARDVLRSAGFPSQHLRAEPTPEQAP